METNELVEYGNKLRELLDEKAELDEAAKKLAGEIDSIQRKFIDLMEAHKVKNFTIDNVGMFYLSSSIYPRVVDQQQLFSDLRQRGAGALIKETVNLNTLRAYVKECLENSNEVPKGVDVYAETKIRVRRA